MRGRPRCRDRSTVATFPLQLLQQIAEGGDRNSRGCPDHRSRRPDPSLLHCVRQRTLWSQGSHASLWRNQLRKNAVAIRHQDRLASFGKMDVLTDPFLKILQRHGTHLHKISPPAISVKPQPALQSRDNRAKLLSPSGLGARYFPASGAFSRGGGSGRPSAGCRKRSASRQAAAASFGSLEHGTIRAVVGPSHHLNNRFIRWRCSCAWPFETSLGSPCSCVQPRSSRRQPRASLSAPSRPTANRCRESRSPSRPPLCRGAERR